MQKKLSTTNFKEKSAQQRNMAQSCTPEFMERFGREWIKHDVLLSGYKFPNEMPKTTVLKWKKTVRLQVLKKLGLSPSDHWPKHFLTKYRLTLMMCVGKAVEEKRGSLPSVEEVMARLPAWAMELEPKMRMLPSVLQVYQLNRPGSEPGSPSATGKCSTAGAGAAANGSTKGHSRRSELMALSSEMDQVVPMLRAMWDSLRAAPEPSWPLALRAAAIASGWSTGLTHLTWSNVRSIVLQKLALTSWSGDHSFPPAELCPADRLALDLALLYTDTRVVTEESVLVREQDGMLRALLSLVQHYRLHEEDAGLEARWRAAAAAYRGKGYSGGLVVLQRRWHELVGVSRTLLLRAARAPCGSRAPRPPPAVCTWLAARFPAALARPRPAWAQLVRDGRVFVDDIEDILGAERGPGGAENEPGGTEGAVWNLADDIDIAKDPNDEDDDIILIENDVETIDLADGDSDTEDKLVIVEYKKIAKKEMCDQMDSELGQLIKYVDENGDISNAKSIDAEDNHQNKTVRDINEKTDSTPFTNDIDARIHKSEKHDDKNKETNTTVEATDGLECLSTGRPSLSILNELDPSQVEAKIIFSDDEDVDMKSGQGPKCINETAGTPFMDSQTNRIEPPSITCGEVLDEQISEENIVEKSDQKVKIDASTSDGKIKNTAKDTNRAKSPSLETNTSDQNSKEDVSPAKSFAGPKSVKMKRNISLNLTFEEDIIDEKSEDSSQELMDIKKEVNKKLRTYFNKRCTENHSETNINQMKNEEGENDLNQRENNKSKLSNGETVEDLTDNILNESQKDEILEIVDREGDSYTNETKDAQEALKESSLGKDSLDKILLATKIPLKRIDQYTFWKKHAQENTIDVKHVGVGVESVPSAHSTHSVRQLQEARLHDLKSITKSYHAEDLETNPDFHVNLKNLSEEYLSKNRGLLSVCRPATVDVERLSPDLLHQFCLSGDDEPLVRARKPVELTDIEEVRRMNRALLTAQVRPSRPAPVPAPHTDEESSTEILTSEQLTAILENLKNTRFRKDTRERDRNGAPRKQHKKEPAKRHCCVARRHLAYNLARTRLNARAGRMPPPLFDLHGLSGEAHNKQTCKCCCLQALRSAPSATVLHTKLNTLRQLFARIRKTGKTSSKSKLPQTQIEEILEKPRKKYPRKKQKRSETASTEEPEPEADPPTAPDHDYFDDAYRAYMREKNMYAKYFTLPSSGSTHSERPVNVVKAKPTGVKLFRKEDGEDRSSEYIKIHNINEIKNELNKRLRTKLKETEPRSNVIAVLPNVAPKPAKHPIKISVTVNEQAAKDKQDHSPDKSVPNTTPPSENKQKNQTNKPIEQNIKTTNKHQTEELNTPNENKTEQTETRIVKNPSVRQEVEARPNTTQVIISTPPVKRPPWLLNKAPIVSTDNQNQMQITKPAQINSSNTPSVSVEAPRPRPIATSVIRSTTNNGTAKETARDTTSIITSVSSNEQCQFAETPSHNATEVRAGVNQGHAEMAGLPSGGLQGAGCAETKQLPPRPGMIIVQPSQTQPRIIIQPSMQFVSQVSVQSQNVIQPVPPPVLRHFIISPAAQAVSPNPLVSQTISQLNIQVSINENVTNPNPVMQYATSSPECASAAHTRGDGFKHIVIRPSIKEWFARDQQSAQQPALVNPVAAQQVFTTAAVNNVVDRHIQNVNQIVTSNNVNTFNPIIQNTFSVTDQVVNSSSNNFSQSISQSNQTTTINVAVNNTSISNQLLNNQLTAPMKPITRTHPNSLLNASVSSVTQTNSTLRFSSTSLAEVTPGTVQQSVTRLLNHTFTGEAKRTTSTIKPVPLKLTNQQSKLFKCNVEKTGLIKSLAKPAVADNDTASISLLKHPKDPVKEPTKEMDTEVVELSDDSDEFQEPNTDLPTITDVRSLAGESAVKDEPASPDPADDQMPKIVNSQSLASEAAPAPAARSQAVVSFKEGGALILTVEPITQTHASQKEKSKRNAGAGAGGGPRERPFRSTDFSTAPPMRVQDFVRARDPTKLQVLCVDASRPLLSIQSRYLLATEQMIAISEPTYWTIMSQNYSRRLIFDHETPVFFVDSSRKRKSPDSDENVSKIKVKSFARMAEAQAGEAGLAEGSGIAAPAEMFTENKLYKKLTEKPLTYAQVWSVVSDRAQAVALSWGDGGAGGLALYDRAAGALCPVQRGLVAGRPGGLRCDGAPDALSALIAIMNEYTSRKRHKSRSAVVSLDSDSDS